SARMTGPKELELGLGRPELLESGDKPFKRGHLYLLDAGRVPQRAHAERGAVIVCIGDSPRLARYRDRCCVIELSKDADFFTTFNTLQHIYDRFDAWEDDINRIIERDGDISRMLTRSEDIFCNPLFAIDADFRMLGASRMAVDLEEGLSFEERGGASLKLDAVDQFLEFHDLSMDEREPLVLSLLDQTTLNQNIFDGGEYRGCLTVRYLQRTYRPSDKPLVSWLAQRVHRAMRELASSAPDGLGSLRQALQDLIEERPLDSLARDVLQKSSEGRRFICMRLKLSSRLDQLPIGYVRNTLESNFAKSIVFEHHGNSVVAIIDIGDLGDDHLATITSSIVPFTTSMQMKAGLSDPFNDLLLSRQLFMQANMALDIGTLIDSESSVYRYQDYVLDGMIMDSLGGMPLELLCPEGLRRLIEHDQTAPTSYVETLRTYLENNANVAKAASMLFVHRSTLIERLQRIRRELGLELDDPDVQLRLRMLLKAMQLRDSLRDASY
ncbi:MAG: helix-turn-helix domain-containing protein, partial [Coriobacteriales bacterium]|nr:helix-turn-helix domain-containing protein [Coriobacteriales bacterium]